MLPLKLGFLISVMAFAHFQPVLSYGEVPHDSLILVVSLGKVSSQAKNFSYWVLITVLRLKFAMEPPHQESCCRMTPMWKCGTKLGTLRSWLLWGLNSSTSWENCWERDTERLTSPASSALTRFVHYNTLLNRLGENICIDSDFVGEHWKEQVYFVSPKHDGRLLQPGAPPTRLREMQRSWRPPGLWSVSCWENGWFDLQREMVQLFSFVGT